MMTTFHWIHIVVGIWLALVNFTNILDPNLLALNNVILGIIVAVYNAYILFGKKNVDVKSEQALISPNSATCNPYKAPTVITVGVLVSNTLASELT